MASRWGDRPALAWPAGGGGLGALKARICSRPCSARVPPRSGRTLVRCCVQRYDGSGAVDVHSSPPRLHCPRRRSCQAVAADEPDDEGQADPGPGPGARPGESACARRRGRRRQCVPRRRARGDRRGDGLGPTTSDGGRGHIGRVHHGHVAACRLSTADLLARSEVGPCRPQARTSSRRSDRCAHRPRYAPPPRCAARATSPPGSGARRRDRSKPAPSPCLPVSSRKGPSPPTSSGRGLPAWPSVRGRRNTCGCAPCASATGAWSCSAATPPCPARCGGGIVRHPGLLRARRDRGEAFVDGGAHSPSNADVLLGADVGLVLVSSPMSEAGDGRVWHSTSPVDDGTAGPRIRGAAPPRSGAHVLPSSRRPKSGGDRAQPDGPDPARSRGTQARESTLRRLAHADTRTRLRPLME